MKDEMREILYKGKSLGGEWVEGHCYFNNEYKQWMITRPVDHDGQEAFGVNKKTIGQYIGRADSQEKKMFVGDIQKVLVYDSDNVGKEWICVIKRDNVHLQYIWEEVEFKIRFTFKQISNYTTIGNTTDNPELLNSNE